MKKILIVVVVVVIVGGGALFILTRGGDSEIPEVRIEYSPGDYFTTNISGSHRILKAAPVLVVNKEGLEDMLAEENTKIRDTIIFILREMTEEEVTAPGRKDALCEKIIAALNERLGIDNFVEVRFNDFVMA